VNRKFFLFLLAVVAAGVFVWKGGPQRWAAPVTPPVKIAPKSLGEVGRMAPKLGPGAHVAALPDVPPECNAAWERLLESDFDGWLEAVGQNHFPTDPKCRDWEKAHWPKELGKFPADSCFDAETIRSYVESMGTESTEPKNPALTACLPMLMIYRSWALNQATKDTPLRSLSAPVLANKILCRMMELDEPKAKPEILEWNARLQELEPDLYATYKIPLIIHAFADLPAPDELAAFLKATDRFDVSDPDVQELRLMEIVKKNDVPAFAQALEEFAVHSPQEPRWDYYRGYVAWKQGNVAEAIRLVGAALTRKPGNTDYSRTLEKMKTETPGAKNTFTFNVSFRFDQL
jgi:hypothetical protein